MIGTVGIIGGGGDNNGKFSTSLVVFYKVFFNEINYFAMTVGIKVKLNIVAKTKKVYFEAI